MAITLSEKLKQQSKQKGFSLDRLAKLTQSSKSCLWELENRDTRKPSAAKLNKIAIALGVTTEYLLDENASTDDAALKEAFFRNFNRLEDDDKEKIKQIIEVWGSKDE